VTFNDAGLGLSTLAAGADFPDNNSANKVLAALDKASRRACCGSCTDCARQQRRHANGEETPPFLPLGRSFGSAPQSDSAGKELLTQQFKRLLTII
jgi:hypothetical protein